MSMLSDTFRQAYVALDDEPSEKRVGWRKLLNYKVLWTAYYLLLPLAVASIIAGQDKRPYLDSAFISLSSITGAGLSTLSMAQFSNSSLIWLILLTLVGSSLFMSIITTFVRQHCFQRVHNKVQSHYRLVLEPQGVQLTASDRKVIAQHNQLDDALRLLVHVYLVYYIGWILLGTLVLYLTLPVQQELVDRGLRQIDNAAFLAVSAHANTGISMTSDSLVGLKNNPAAYITLTMLIVAGNSAAPIFLRAFLTCLLRLDIWLTGAYPAWMSNRRALKLILAHPRKLTMNIFDSQQSIYLGRMVLTFIIVQYALFLVSTLFRKEAFQDQSTSELLGIGYFQTLSVRSAGFSMMDLRILSQGLLMVYLVMMYLSAFPIQTTVKRSTDHSLAMVASEKIQGEEDVVNVLHQQQPSISDAASAMDGDLTIISTLSPNDQLPSNHVEFDLEAERDERRRRSSSAETTVSEAPIPLQAINRSFLNQYLFRHSFFVFLAVFICAYSEDKLLQPGHPVEVNLFYIFFEIISAYGSVGLSMGVPGHNYSLSGALSSVGKLTIMSMMLMGKLRGLPASTEDVVDYEFLEYQQAWHYDNDDDQLKPKEV